MASQPILFFNHSDRALVSSMVGHLHEVSQEHRVVLLSEPLSEAYHEHLKEPSLFPGLEAIHIEHCLGFSVPELMRENRRWLELVRRLLDTYQPQMVIGENDMSSVFDMYLLREARRRGIPRLTIQAMGQLRETSLRKVTELHAASRNGEAPWGPVGSWRRLRHRVRKHLGHVLVHYFVPWMAGQPALRGGSSYVRRSGAPGMRDTQLHLVQGHEQLRLFLESGVPSKRLGILGHPLDRISPDVFFPTAAVVQTGIGGPRKRFLVLLGTLTVGLERQSHRVIPAEERLHTQLRVLEALGDVLDDWEIVIKAHPDFGTAAMVRERLGAMSEGTTVADPAGPVEPFFRVVDGVLDLPSPNTSSLVTAASALPGRPVIAVDADHDVIGEHYARWSGVDYVDSIDGLREILEAVKDGTYTRRVFHESPPADVPIFSHTNEAISFLLAERSTVSAVGKLDSESEQ